jgi:transposase
MSANSSRRYPPEVRERAVRMVAEVRAQHDTEWAAMRAVAELLGWAQENSANRWAGEGDTAGGPGHAG